MRPWALLALLAAGPKAGDTLVVSHRGPFRSIAEALLAAADGDTVEVRGGVWREHLVIDRSIALVGVGDPVVDGGGQGTLLTILAPGVEVRGLTFRGTGNILDLEDAAISVNAPGARITGNLIEDSLFGIYLREAHGSAIRRNTILGKDLPVPRRGDGIRVWSSHDVVVAENTVRGGRDIVLWYSERIRVVGNRISAGRYGLHFMYCDDAEIVGNLLQDNSVGAFLMYSRRLLLRRNTIVGSHGPSGYAIGLKAMDDAVVEENLLADNRIGIHIDGSPREVEGIGIVRGNLIARNGVGVRLMPAVRHNRFWENAFVANGEQVAMAGGGGNAANNSWSVEGRGNHWSDYRGYDADGDGIGDLPYRSEGLFEDLLLRHDILRLFAGSPAADALDFAARAFPLVRPRPKLVDAAPLTALPPLPATPAPKAPPPGPLGAAAAALLLFAAGVAVVSRPLGGGS